MREQEERSANFHGKWVLLDYLMEIFRHAGVVASFRHGGVVDLVQLNSKANDWMVVSSAVTRRAHDAHQKKINLPFRNRL